MPIKIFYAFIATIITWLFTAAGAGTALFLRKINDNFLGIAIGLASGIMIASSFWSLLTPALQISNPFVVSIGFILGAVVVYLSETIIDTKKSKFKKLTKIDNNLFLMILSITIHNIPEGLAVGVAFGMIDDIRNKEEIFSAIALALGIAIQNFPEGAAVSLPLRSHGLTRKKSFLIGQASALVEPLFGVIGATVLTAANSILPICLSFAAGCMFFVVIYELIPGCKQNGRDNISSFSFILGFIIMMILDVLL